MGKFTRIPRMYFKGVLRMIKEFALVSRNDEYMFTDELSKKIAEYQTKGYQVEIQYSINDTYCSALVIGRQKA